MHPSPHRPPRHAAGRRRWQARTGSRRLDPTIRNLPLCRVLHRASRAPRAHVLRRPLTRARRHDCGRPLRPPPLRRHRRQRRQRLLLCPRLSLRIGDAHLRRPPTLPATPLSRPCRAHRQTLRHPPSLPSHQLLRSEAAAVHLCVRMLHAGCRREAASSPIVPLIRPPCRSTLLHKLRLRRHPLLRQDRRPRRRRILHTSLLPPSSPPLPYSAAS